jgi:hypothetical protein
MRLSWLSDVIEHAESSPQAAYSWKMYVFGTTESLLDLLDGGMMWLLAKLPGD